MVFASRPLLAVFLIPAIIAITAIPAAQADEVKKGNETKEHKAVAPKHADEEKIRKSVAAFLGVPESVVESVTRIPQGGLYEILLINGELFYADKKVSFLIFGTIFDTKTRRNLTNERLDKLASIDFKSLPMEQAFKRINGNGKRVIVTFEDPNCGYCKHLGKELQKVKDVTIYTFLYPILSGDSMTKSRHIWCAENNTAAWTAWIFDGKAPEARNCNSDVVDRNVELGRKLRMTGTPVIFFADGTRIAGYRDAPALEQALADVSAEAGK